MSDLKISEIASKLAEDLENTTLTEGDMVKRIVPNAERIQLAINEACRPLVEACEWFEKLLAPFVKDHARDHAITPCECGKCVDYRWLQRILIAHQKEHG